MTTDTSNIIIRAIRKQGQVTAKSLVNMLGFSPQAVFKQLKRLIEKGVLQKIGQPPKVFYMLAEPTTPALNELPVALRKIIDSRYLFVTPEGQMKAGLEGFALFCQKHHLNLDKTAGEYSKTLKKYDRFRRRGLIDGTAKIRSTFKEVFLDKAYYLDFYSIERFGKTRLGQLLLYAKQSQNRLFMKRLIDELKPQIGPLIKTLKIDAVGFVPATVYRPIQFMKELQRGLNLNVPIIPLIKIRTEVVVPQKTLNKLEDRIINARKTFHADKNGFFKNVLLIDDAVGSGSTLNEIARQLKQKKIAKKVIGLAITGSYKGFEVISEV